jgi:hypothetical protein
MKDEEISLEYQELVALSTSSLDRVQASVAQVTLLYPKLLATGLC